MAELESAGLLGVHPERKGILKWYTMHLKEAVEQRWMTCATSFCSGSDAPFHNFRGSSLADKQKRSLVTKYEYCREYYAENPRNKPNFEDIRTKPMQTSKRTEHTIIYSGARHGSAIKFSNRLPNNNDFPNKGEPGGLPPATRLPNRIIQAERLMLRAYAHILRTPHAVDERLKISESYEYVAVPDAPRLKPVWAGHQCVASNVAEAVMPGYGRQRHNATHARHAKCNRYAVAKDDLERFASFFKDSILLKICTPTHIPDSSLFEGRRSAHTPPHFPNLSIAGVICQRQRLA
ncbi:hypothetical protein CPC08DRAFT_725175 [Agrocybe pediades]|nr:hypothetical protein CPC08DRAFT_725175 [Agrocybe pediades]